MKTILFLFVLGFSLSSLQAQEFPIDTAKLNTTYRELISKSNHPIRQKAFFDAFPNSWEEFYLTFRHSNDPQYDLSMHHLGVAQTEALGNRVTRLPDSLYCSKLVNISMNGDTQMEAAKALQKLVQSIMWRRMPGMFEALSSRTRDHQMQFWKFYWSGSRPNKDMEVDFYRLYKINHDVYPQEAETMKEAYERFYQGVGSKR